MCYYLGDGVTEDFVEAYKWFLLAGTSGNERVDKTRTAIAKFMTAAQIAEAQAQAKKWQTAHEQAQPEQ